MSWIQRYKLRNCVRNSVWILPCRSQPDRGRPLGPSRHHSLVPWPSPLTTDHRLLAIDYGSVITDYWPLAPRHLPLLLSLFLLLTGCRSIGPGSVARDRFDYNTAISESWKRQTLLNVVKLRYLDPPIFVDVGQIVSGYSLETGVSVGGQLAKTGAGDQFAAAGGHAVFTDRPTITYTPLTGNKFVKSLLTPLTPESVFFMIQAGWPADSVLLLTVASLNGLKNQESTMNGTVPPDKDFLRVLALMRRIQLSSGVAFRVRQDAQKQQTALLTFHRQNITPETLADSTEARRLLRLDPDATEFKLVFGATAADNKEIAGTHSLDSPPDADYGGADRGAGARFGRALHGPGLGKRARPGEGPADGGDSQFKGRPGKCICVRLL